MKKTTSNFSSISKKILYLGLPLILTYFIYLTISINSHVNTSKEVLIHIYAPQLEYIMMSLVILIIGSLLFDITAKELEIMKK